MLWDENKKLRLLFDSDHRHLPEKDTYCLKECELHEWALEELESDGDMFGLKGKKVKGELLLCPTCDIVLCLPCYNLFHTAENINDLEVGVRDHLMSEDDEQDAARLMVVYTSRFRKRKMEVDGKILMETTKHYFQRRCMECNKKTVQCAQNV